MENYKPFISEGVVSLVGDENSSQKVKILRDSGATQSLMLDSEFKRCKSKAFD